MIIGSQWYYIPVLYMLLTFKKLSQSSFIIIRSKYIIINCRIKNLSCINMREFCGGGEDVALFSAHVSSSIENLHSGVGVNIVL